MNNKYIKKIDIIIIICILFILIYSTLLLYNINNKNNIIYKKIFHIIISLIIKLYIINFDKKYYIKNAYIIYIICNLLLLYVSIYGYTINGAKRWIDIKFIKFQPSEIAKISVPILISKIISNNNYPIKNIKKIILIIIITLIPSILIYLQPDLGTSILILLYGIIGLYLSGIDKKIISLFIIILILIIPFSWKFLLHKYQKNRIIILFNNNDILNNGYQINQSKIAIGSGGLYGKGIFLGTQSKFNFIPENTTDFILTLIAEEHGFIGIFIILLIYIILIIKSFIICINNNNDIFNKLLISNLIINFCIHIFINIGMVIGILPIVGIPLPLVSYGGTSLIINISIFGIIMSLKKNI